jgi:hypothetical protein
MASRALRKGLAKHRWYANSKALPRSPYQPYTEALRQELQDIRDDAMYRYYERQDKRLGIDLDARAEEVWKRLAYDDTEERQGRSCVIHSWWPKLEERIIRHGLTYVKPSCDEARLYRERKAFQAVFGPLPKRGCYYI